MGSPSFVPKERGFMWKGIIKQKKLSPGAVCEAGKDRRPVPPVKQERSSTSAVCEAEKDHRRMPPVKRRKNADWCRQQLYKKCGIIFEIYLRLM